MKELTMKQEKKEFQITVKQEKILLNAHNRYKLKNKEAQQELQEVVDRIILNTGVENFERYEIKDQKIILHIAKENEAPEVMQFNKKEKLPILQ